MASRLRFVGRWFAVALGTLVWLIVVPVMELAHALTKQRRKPSTDEKQNVPAATPGTARPFVQP